MKTRKDEMVAAQRKLAEQKVKDAEKLAKLQADEEARRKKD